MMLSAARGMCMEAHKESTWPWPFNAEISKAFRQHYMGECREGFLYFTIKKVSPMVTCMHPIPYLLMFKILSITIMDF